MDARSIAATAANGGVLTPATDLPRTLGTRPASTPLTTRRTRSACTGALQGGACRRAGRRPNIKPWPAMEPLGDDILLKVCSKIMDPVTTTDELIPSGETSSFRSNRWAWLSLR